VEGKLPYNYATISYLQEKRLTHSITVVAEPYFAFINRPNDGLDVGLNLYAKAYLPEVLPKGRLYVTAGSGAAYTSVNLSEQGTHGLFILSAGIGYRIDRFFVENRFHHYSNGGLAKPNRSVNSMIVRIGCYL
jgi:hypothetical protein